MSDRVNETSQNGDQPATPEGLNLEQFRLSQDFQETAGVRKLLTTVPVRKPAKQSFVRARPGPDWRLSVAMIEVEREFYIVQGELASQLVDEISLWVLRTAIDRLGVVFLWPLRLPDPSGRQQNWHRSAMEAAEVAETRWVRVQANMSLAAYEVFEAQGDLSDPEWPDESFHSLVSIAFRERQISTPDHPVLRQLRGEI